MTQCILSHIFSAAHEINQNRLQTYYEDCLNKDQILDDMAANQEDNIARRQVEYYNQYRSI